MISSISNNTALLRTILFMFVGICLGCLGCNSGKELVTQDPDEKLAVWPNSPPGPALPNRESRDQTKRSDELIAGRPIIRMSHVSTPELQIFFPPEDLRTTTAVVVCPGGGFNILAWDLEGTEVANWLNSLGITAVVLKYRVPTRRHKPMWQAGVQDAQRAMGLVRAHAESWNIDPEKIGILGFSAGGCIAVRTCLTTERTYSVVDDADKQSSQPNFAILIYPDLVANKKHDGLWEGLKVDSKTPPAFLVHAEDDKVAVENSQIYHSVLLNAGVESGLYVCKTGGHGFGLRRNEQESITEWPVKCERWLAEQNWIPAADAKSD